MAVSITKPSLIKVPLIQAFTQAVTFILTKSELELTGRPGILGKPKVIVLLVLLVRVTSSQTLVTGVIVIDPSVVVLLLTHSRSQAWVTLLAVMPAGRVPKLNFKKERHTRVPLLVTRRLALAPLFVVFFELST